MSRPTTDQDGRSALVGDEGRDLVGPRLAEWARTAALSGIRAVEVSLIARPGLIQLGLGLPAPELMPSEAFGRALATVLDSDPAALQYEVPRARLREQIAALMTLRGVTCESSQIVVTAGAQQGMDLLARMLLDRGATVVVEEHSYSGFKQVLEPYRVRLLTVPTDPATGMDVGALEELLARGERPSVIYAMADGHNPLGVSMSREKRVRLVAAARRYKVPIIEDDAYGYLTYTADPLPPLRALDDQWVLYVGTFSKIVAPAIRVGWVILPSRLVPVWSVIKAANDVDSATLTQRALTAFLADSPLADRIAMLRREYAARRDAMLEALARWFPRDARWTQPDAGLFVWVELPPDVDVQALLVHAVEREGVAFVPGATFAAAPTPRSASSLRLCHSHCGPEAITEGVRRLAKAVDRFPRAKRTNP